MLPSYDTKFGAFREIIISRATSGGRWEIELNSESLPLIPGGLATLLKGLRLPNPALPLPDFFPTVPQHTSS